MTTTTASLSTLAAPTVIATGSVTSKDGTPIGYRQVGGGPGLVLVHGAMESALSHLQLAHALADAFTVTMIDRRGRGLSGPYGPGYGVHKDIEDLDAVLAQTGAQRVFGVSSGGVIVLEAALRLPAIHKVAVYEPALIINGSPSTDFLARYDQELAEGNLAAALVTGMKGTQMGPAIFNALPRWLLERLTSSAMASEDKQARAGDVSMRQLAPTLHYDFQLIRETDGALQRFRAIRAQVLLLGGSASPTYLKNAMNALAVTFPNANRIEFPGLGHGASGPTNRGGQPKKIAQPLREFFSE
jgi:pimeloyl-ACP methyl ester carboxylesterase